MTSFEPILNHVAILTGSVEQTAAKLAKLGFFIGSAEKWEGEGTLEIYVGESSQRARLLLMEPYKDGAYQRAMEKRGPGLHHIAIDVNDLQGYIESLSGSGWILHKNSAQSMVDYKTAWLWKSGVGALIEVQQREGHQQALHASRLITQVGVPLPLHCKTLISALGCPEFFDSDEGDCYFDAELKRIKVKDLLS